MSDLGPVDPGHHADVEWLHRWRLRPEGDARTTASSTLIPVRTAEGVPAMLKLAHLDEEERGGELLERLAGRGVARVLRREGAAVLIERATGPNDLVRMVLAGHDDEATRVLCATAAQLHVDPADLDGTDPSTSGELVVPSDAGGAPLVPLTTWFRELFAHADDLEPLHRRGAELADGLLAAPRDERVLHGDVHHGNVLDFGERGWLAIDPKGLVGESAFDFCNLLCNPSHERALAPGRLERQFGVVLDATARAGAPLDSDRFAQWLVAWCALSSTWFVLDDDPAHADGVARIGELALGLLD
ncbi:aminoglycoside phosphotransferase family protein [Agromyces sp. NPDC058126]|uniref:aminoglycoside phosphotransferase family protein n=1 Tax=Agromyces sp. NPDC058126 TaxID=3346350 RepID=UPI0036D84863